MAALPAEPQHVGDVTYECPECGDELAVPVLCEFVPGDNPAAVTLRCSPNLGPARDHLVDVHGARLSRPR